MTHLTFRLNFHPETPPIAWGKSDSPFRPLCAICSAKLPEVPLIMWAPDGSCASFCDDCVERWIAVSKSQ